MRWPIPLLVSCLVGLPACDLLTTKIDPDLAAGLVESVLTNEGLTVSSVSCPEGVKAEKDAAFECTATVDGTEVHFAMKILDGKGTVTATPRDHTLVVKKVEPEIAADLKAKGHDVSKIDCHGDVWVAVQGAKVSCDVTDEAGVEYLWTAEFTDDDGTHNHSIAPK
ncbi:MAG: DUF4333 domain-containing protein [Nannocystaceae bacterium]|nr:DUF4333 domain-containing protein [Nannocystaceae bacterium]